MKQTVLRTFAGVVISIGFFSLFSSLALAQPTFFSDRSTFESAFPGLPVEDFEESAVLPTAVLNCGVFNPIDSTIDDDCFDPGDILAGVSFSLNPANPPDEDFVTIGAGGAGLPNTSIFFGPNTFGDGLDINFPNGTNPPVCSVGFDIVAAAAAGSMCDIEVYDTSDTLLGSTTIECDNTKVDFIGLHSTEAIGRVNIEQTSAAGELIDNLAFGPCNSDVSLSKTSDTEIYSPGSTVVYTLTVTGNGPDTAQNVEVTDSVPSGLTYVSDDCGSGAPHGGEIHWNIGSLEIAGVATCNITFTVDNDAIGILSNTATVSSASTDSDSSNDSATALSNPNLSVVLEKKFKAKKGRMTMNLVTNDVTATAVDLSVLFSGLNCRYDVYVAKSKGKTLPESGDFELLTSIPAGTGPLSLILKKMPTIKPKRIRGNIEVRLICDGGIEHASEIEVCRFKKKAKRKKSYNKWKNTLRKKIDKAASSAE